MDTPTSKPASYAPVSWTAADVQTLAPKFTLEQAEDWLADNAHHIQNRLSELGHEVIRDLLGNA